MRNHGDRDGGGATRGEGGIGGVATARRRRRRRRRRKVEEARVRIRKTNGAATKDRAPDGGDGGNHRKKQQERVQYQRHHVRGTRTSEPMRIFAGRNLIMEGRGDGVDRREERGKGDRLNKGKMA